MTLIAVGKIVNVHGIKGVVKIKPYLMHGKDLPQFNPLTDKTGKKSFEVSISGTQGECLLANLKGITTREVAEQFKGLELYADRSKLPAIENNEFYCYKININYIFANLNNINKLLTKINFFRRWGWCLRVRGKGTTCILIRICLHKKSLAVC